MKKMISLFMAVLMLLLMTTTALAGNSATLAMSVSPASFERGTEVTVTIKLNNCDKLKSLALVFDYDVENVFEVVSGEWLLSGMLLSDFDTSTVKAGTAAVAFSSETDANGDIFKLKLKVKDSASAGEKQIKVTPTIKNDNVDILCPAATKTITITVPCEHANTVIINKKDASCTAKGYTGDTYCNDCKSTIAYGKEIDMISHEWIDDDANDKAATCTEGGYDAEKCSRCPATRHINEKKALGHDWVADDENDKAATCTEGGYDAEKCSRCPETRHVNEKKALGHDLKESIIKEATCTESGTKDIVCKREGCEYAEKSVEIPALGHQWGTWTTVKAASEKEAGIEKRVCEKCEAEETRETKKLSKESVPSIVLDGKENKMNKEVNPNTGATVCIGVMALIALSGAGVVISRKKH